MDAAEQWKSLSRHHTVLEWEAERLRAAVRGYRRQIARIMSLLPGVDLGPEPVVPSETPPWTGTTYRDPGGKFPRDIGEKVDWLSEEDFK